MTVRLAINGFGRIGRCLLRALVESSATKRESDDITLVAINELADLPTMAYLTKFDSTHGRFPGEVKQLGSHALGVNGREVHVSHIEAPSQLPWNQLEVDLVLECTGTFTSREIAAEHLAAGASKVLFSQPATADVDATIVRGINEHILKAEHEIVSAASCTTNCIVPVIDVLDRAFGVENGVITTIHSAMNDQPVLDAYHHTNLRKTRAAGQSIIPVDTGLAVGVSRILPKFAGKFAAQAMRVPTLNVSAMDLSVVVHRDVSIQDVNDALREAADTRLKTILGYTAEPLASCDFIHDPHSGTVDASQTCVSGRLVKILTWFDNE